MGNKQDSEVMDLLYNVYNCFYPFSLVLNVPNPEMLVDWRHNPKDQHWRGKITIHDHPRQLFSKEVQSKERRKIVKSLNQCENTRCRNYLKSLKVTRKERFYCTIWKNSQKNCMATSYELINLYLIILRSLFDSI